MLLSHMMGTLLFHLSLLFSASSIVMVIVFWNPSAGVHVPALVWSFSCLWKLVRRSCLSRSQPPALAAALFFNPVLLCSFRPGLDRPLRSPEVTSLPLHAVGSLQPALELSLAPQESSSWTSFVESSPVNPFAGGKKRGQFDFFFFEGIFLVKFN